MNIFSTIRKYAGKWNVVGADRAFTAEEIAAVDYAEVVASQYGNSVKFCFTNGEMGFIPLSNDSSKSVGDKIDLQTAKIRTLSKPGEADITRIVA